MNPLNQLHAITPLAWQPRRWLQGWSLAARLCGLLAVVLVFMQFVQLFKRAGRVGSDFGVFYRTATLLNNGSGGEIYTQRDSATGWPISIPPAGLVVFDPLVELPPLLAGAIWAVINLALLVGAIVALRRFLDKLDRQQRVYQSVFPWMVIIFLLLSTGSIQVGQFSLPFVACWIFFLYATANGNCAWAGLSLAIPSAIKLYPALLLAVPLADIERYRKELIFFFLSIVLVCGVVPALVYGPRVGEITLSFFQNAIFSEEGRVTAMQMIDTQANQSLDVVMQRYLSYDPAFHARYPGIPHLSFEPQQVLQLAHVVRLCIILASAAVVFRWQRHDRSCPLYKAMCMAALWSAALYLILPETRSRYAVYTFLAFLPPLGAAVGAGMRANRLAYMTHCALIMFCLMLMLQFMPRPLRIYGPGFIGVLILWLFNVSHILSLSSAGPGKLISDPPSGALGRKASRPAPV